MKKTQFFTMAVAGLVIGFFVTVSTVLHRTVTTQNQVTGGVCNGPWCDDTLVQAGFPFAYLRDSLGTSVIGSLGIEDRFLFGTFLMDWLLISFILYLLMYIFLALKMHRDL